MSQGTFRDLRSIGWQGFRAINSFAAPFSSIPDVKGLYLVLCDKADCPTLLPKSVGGWFKGRNPSVEAAKLAARWVTGTPILYIGKAGGDSKVTLRDRLKLYLGFGKGQRVAHWGGRYIWQLANHADLVVCWRVLPEGDPVAEERKLLQEFVARHGRLPFANLKMG